ncbi:Thiamine-phosphate synthase [invertebrate metagenome]|uniref:thiamine phosphate synthase n=1 Tax=invertebrate metagenome TaxID=1711999 RepID=A0A2H9T6P7_9ZZZZ
MQRLKGLYGITDSQIQPDDNSLTNTVEQALLGGMKILQYRDKTHDNNKRMRQAGILKTLCHRYHALLIINDDIELAALSEADGVHLGQSDSSVAEARDRLGDYAIIGVSCEGSLDQAQVAADEGADYLAFGRFFPSLTKPDAKPAEVNILTQAKARFSLPLVGIGGITIDNAPELVKTGADMLAVVNNLFAADDILSRAKAFTGLFHFS